MSTEIRCHTGCGTWYPKEQRECPKCGTEQRKVNVALASQGWRSNLNMQAEQAARYG